jgi:hypothetical protein
MTEETPQKYFTVEEANRMLPLVGRIVSDIVELFGSVHERRLRLERIRHRRGSDSHEQGNLYDEELLQMEKELEKGIRRVEEFIGELKSLNVELKDPVAGLVDFRSQVDGRDIYLCWKLGEEEIGHWHELDTGFSGRQPLLENSVAGDDETMDENQ